MGVEVFDTLDRYFDGKESAFATLHEAALGRPPLEWSDAVGVGIGETAFAITKELALVVQIQTIGPHATLVVGPVLPVQHFRDIDCGEP